MNTNAFKNIDIHISKYHSFLKNENFFRCSYGTYFRAANDTEPSHFGLRLNQLIPRLDSHVRLR